MMATSRGQFIHKTEDCTDILLFLYIERIKKKAKQKNKNYVLFFTYCPITTTKLIK